MTEIQQHAIYLKVNVSGKLVSSPLQPLFDFRGRELLTIYRVNVGMSVRELT